MKKLNKKGFTIIELVIVIAVIAILAAVLIPTFTNVIAKANESKALQEARSLYENVLAIDLADGEQNGKEGKGDGAKAISLESDSLKSEVTGITALHYDGTAFLTFNGEYFVERNADGEFVLTKAKDGKTEKGETFKSTVNEKISYDSEHKNFTVSA